uniref:NADH-ubiquinone oxidoreductase chain 4 n=1 Tax=Neotrogla sp. 5 KY-2017 TaxID=2051645 RepID=A0A343QCB7_9NEOP|nr:NADH dehydrogenase subunit 4 [Neotrogla sp. 5 KY-2017]
MLSILFMVFGLIPVIMFCSYLEVQFFFFFLVFIYIFNEKGGLMYESMSMYFGEDLISYLLIVLSFWICSMMIISSISLFKVKNFDKLFLFLVYTMMLMLYLSFSSLNFFLFYVFFEGSLIVILLMVLGYGYQPERLRAGIYMLFYTLFGSLPLFGGLMYLSVYYGSLSFFFFESFINYLSWGSFMFYLVMIMAFLIKLPLFCFHLWLPKAHVEAPVAGSMILAGVLLKFGSYGLYRLFSLVYSVGLYINLYFIILSLVGAVLVSLLCFRQFDLSSLIAYSSVVHMGVLVSGMMTLSMWGMSGGLIMMIAHGLCSSGLFALSNMSYERVGSRNVFLNRGLLNLIPNLSFWWFLFCIMNMACPPSMNLLGEIGLLNSLVGWSWISMICLMMISFFSAGYSLYLYSYSQHGKIYGGYFSYNSGYVSEYLLLFLHFLPLNLFVLNSDFFLVWCYKMNCD